MIGRRFCWLAPLLALLLGACPAQQSSSRRGDRSILDDLRDDEDTRDDNGDTADSAVAVAYSQLPDAVVEQSDTGIPNQNVDRLRPILCEGRTGEPVIFYRLIVSTHWHYYWLCSDTKARRASSRYGAQHIRRWLRGFKREARLKSQACQGAVGTPVLRGTHESGVRATAYCDGRLVLVFPDGGKTTKTFSSQGYSSPGTVGGSAASCPPCPACPQLGAGGAVNCPPQRPCPPPRACPACPPQKPCPACDCTVKMKDAGKKGFWQGVKKSCARICQMIYTECRRINPKTAMCHMLQEYCDTHCSKP